MRLEQSVEIARAPEDVYAYLADPANLPEWQQEVEAVERMGEGPLGPGETFRERRTFLGRRLESVVEVLGAEPAREFTIRTRAGPLPFTVRHLLERTHAGGTRLTVVGEADVPAALGLVARGVAPAARRRLDGDLERLKAVLEETR